LRILDEEPGKKTNITLGGVSLLIYVLVADSRRGVTEKTTTITLGGVSLLLYVLVADSGRGAREKDDHYSWWSVPFNLCVGCRFWKRSQGKRRT
jgi:hypothetical protein